MKTFRVTVHLNDETEPRIDDSFHTLARALAFEENQVEMFDERHTITLWARGHRVSTHEGNGADEAPDTRKETPDPTTE